MGAILDELDHLNARLLAALAEAQATLAELLSSEDRRRKYGPGAILYSPPELGDYFFSGDLDPDVPTGTRDDPNPPGIGNPNFGR